MIRDPKSLAEACAKALANNTQMPDESFQALPVRLCAIQDACTRFVFDVQDHQSERARGHVIECASTTLGTLWLIGNDQWSLRLRLAQRPWPFVTADQSVQYIRLYAGYAFRAWERGNRKDVLFALELVAVGCSDLAHNAYGKDLDDLVLEALAATKNEEGRAG